MEPEPFSLHGFHEPVRRAAPFRTTPFDVRGIPFECPPRYGLLRPIGQGAYGVVCSAVDRETGEKVAIKRIAGVVDNVVDCKRTLRELRLLRHFRHENVISMRDVYVASSHGPNFHDVYTVTELMDTDLHQIITSSQGLSDEHCQYFIYQMLCALKHIHSANVLHRDLKPANILLNENCDLKICDFGLARVNPDERGNLTAYVATRWYRAPEVMLSMMNYTKALDVWSMGCIIGEILGRVPLFRGENHVSQLHLMTDMIGALSPSDTEWIESEAALRFVKDNLMQKPGKSLEVMFPGSNSLLRDLLAKMLQFDPRRRITVEEALQHPYFSELHGPAHEPLCEAVFNFEFDNMDNVDRDTLRGLIWQEILLYHPELSEVYGNPFA